MNQRLKILELIESGQIDAEEGVRRLEQLSRTEDGEGMTTTDEGVSASGVAGGRSPAGAVPLPVVGLIWQVVFGMGVFVLAAGGFLLARAYGRPGLPGLTWRWVLFAFGLLGLVLGWWLRRARWLTVRVREHEGPAFTIAVPLPLGLAVWVVRRAGPFVPQLRELEADTLMLAVQDELREGRPFVLRVDEDEEGDHVEVTIC